MDTLRCILDAFENTSTDWVERARKAVESSGDGVAIAMFPWAVL